MRFLTMLIVSICCLTSSLAVAQQTPVPMQSALDSRLKDILQIVVGSVVGRIPGVIHDGTNFTVNDSTQLHQGAIDGLLNIRVGTPADDDKLTPLFDTQAQVAIRFYQGATGEQALLSINTTGQLSTEAFIQFVQLLNQGICKTAANGQCSFVPVVDVSENALPASQRGKLAIERLKSNLLAHIDAQLATAGNDEPQQSFGGSSDASETNAVDAEKLQKMRAAIDAGLQIVTGGGETAVIIDMNAVRNLSSDLTEINPALGALQMFTNIHVKIGDSSSEYTLVVESQISKNLIVNYDAYIQQEQSRDQLESLHTLVTKITWWASGRCTKEKYQEMCINKLLNSCAKSVSSVNRCVIEAGLVQKAREFKNLLGIGN